MKFFRKLGIDLGTANFLIWEEGEGIVLNEPTVVAVEIESRKVMAVGEEAKKMLGKTPEYIEVIRPMHDGVVADFDITEAMLRIFLQKIMGNKWFFGPEVIISVPAGVTQVEQRAVLDAILSAGARKAYLIDKPLAAAIGAKVPVAEPGGHMIVDMGAGATESAIISLGGVVINKSVRIGGKKIDEGIIEYLKKKYNLYIGEQIAENVKMSLGSAVKLKHAEKMEVNGRDSVSGLPKTVEIDSDEINEAIKPYLDVIINTVKFTLEEAMPELVADIVDKGIVLCGGGAMLRNINVLITREIGVSAHVTMDPQLCVVKGAGIVIENLDVYENTIK